MPWSLNAFAFKNILYSVPEDEIPLDGKFLNEKKKYSAFSFNRIAGIRQPST